MVEAAYGKSPMVSQIWIYGNSYKSFVVGVVVPNSERFIEIGRSKVGSGNNHPCELLLTKGRNVL